MGFGGAGGFSLTPMSYMRDMVNNGGLRGMRSGAPTLRAHEVWAIEHRGKPQAPRMLQAKPAPSLFRTSFLSNPLYFFFTFKINIHW